MNRTTRSLIALGLTLAAGLITLAAAGCQTVQGVGKDIQYVGEKSEEAITK